MLQRAWAYARFLHLQRVIGFEVPNEPHLDPETLDWLTARMPSAQSYLEFGAGGSTRLAGRLGIPTVSVEGDRFFARAVRAGLAPQHRVTLIDADIGPTTYWGVPLRGKPSPARVRKWRRYIDLPFELLQRNGQLFPDLALIDGRFRRACALRTAQEAAKAGAHCDLLFDDYYNEGREGYASVEQHLGLPRRIGRSARFKLAPDVSVPDQAIEQAIRDFR